MGDWPIIIIFCGVSFGLGRFYQYKRTCARFNRRALKISRELSKILFRQAHPK